MLGEVTEAQGYKILTSYRFQCDRCNELGFPRDNESQVSKEAEEHIRNCVPADPFMTDESGNMIKADQIEKRLVPRDIPGYGLLKWILTGNAHVTFVNTVANEKFTYHITQAKRRPSDPEDSVPPHFISVLTGPNNTDDYTYIGTVFHNTDGDRYVHHRNSGMSQEAPSVVNFQYVYMAIYAGAVPDFIEVWHEGRCCMCGRLLTDPDSIERGIGPVCLGKM